MESNHYKDGYVPYLKANEDEKRGKRGREGGGGDSKGIYCYPSLFVYVCIMHL